MTYIPTSWFTVMTIVSERPKDCADIQAEGFRYSGVFTIYPAGASEEGIEVFCDLHTEGGGWMVSRVRIPEEVLCVQ